MDDETEELQRLQRKAKDLMQAAISTAEHRPDMASVSAGWAHEASLELMRFAKGKSPQLTIPEAPKPVEGEG